MSDLENKIKECRKQAYIDYQKASGLKVGDKVKVTRKAESFENGWTCTWVEYMDSYVGETHVISSIEPNGAGVMLEGGWYFPFFVLEKVPESISEFLSHTGTWVKSACTLEQVEGFSKFGSDKDYSYSYDCDMLYRTKRE